ncbi:spore coat associated protein CotJA [Paenibacillus sediminis]|uniref:Spore coat protein JA n=1 Tax=Paenibacillus sediminis TaxID=664909 RepID=A0ABS4H5P7_9BACL|nr:spore coat protein JA [Paenibacillus sediminis]
MKELQSSQERSYTPFIGPFDPCVPVTHKTYVIPPNQYIVFQPLNLPQFPLQEALKLGTLWPALYSPYESRRGRREQTKDGNESL